MGKVVLREALAKGLIALDDPQRNVEGLVELQNMLPWQTGLIPYSPITSITQAGGVALGEDFPWPQIFNTPFGTFAFGESDIWSVNTTTRVATAVASVIDWRRRGGTSSQAYSISAVAPWQAAVFEQNILVTDGANCLFTDGTTYYGDYNLYLESVCNFRNRLLTAGVGALTRYGVHNILDMIGDYESLSMNFQNALVTWSELSGDAFMHLIDFGYAMEGHSFFPNLLTDGTDFSGSANWQWPSKGLGAPTEEWEVASGLLKQRGAVAANDDVTYTIPTLAEGIYKFWFEVDLFTGACTVSISGATNTVGMTGAIPSGNGDRYYIFFQHPGGTDVTVTFTATNFNGRIREIGLSETAATDEDNQIRRRFKAGEFGWITLPQINNGELKALKPMDNGVVVYGKDAIYSLIPAGKEFSVRKIADFGVYSSGAIACLGNRHMFLDKTGRLWTIGPDFSVEPLYYESNWSTAVVAGYHFVGSVDVFNKRLCIAHSDGTGHDNDKTFILTETGLGMVREAITSIYDATSAGDTVGYSPDFTLSDPERASSFVKTAEFDFGSDGIKTFRNVHIEAKYVSGSPILYARALYRPERRAELKIGDWVPVDASGDAGLFVSGVACAVEVWCTVISTVHIYSITLNFDDGKMLSSRPIFKRY